MIRSWYESSMIVQPIPVGARLADTITVLTDTTCKALKAAGMDGVVRYWETLTPAEVQNILDASLGLSVCGYSRAPGWVPSAALGTQDGYDELAKAQALFGQVMEDMDLWIDLEGCAGPSEATSEYLQAAGAALTSHLARAGVYVGDDPGGLDGPGLYAPAAITGYWRSPSIVPEPACGYSRSQLWPTVFRGGVSVDIDFCGSDRRGRVGTWIVAG
jgi:hypothetical protein